MRLSRLGYADDSRTGQLVGALLDWQWPDGGWNCDRHRDARRSSFHESAIPALGLATYAAVAGDAASSRAAERTAALLLEHRLFRSMATGEPIHPSWQVLHYPSYWHYDILLGLRLLAAVDRLSDPRAHGRLGRPRARSARRRSVLRSALVIESATSGCRLGSQRRERPPQRVRDKNPHCRRVGQPPEDHHQRRVTTAADRPRRAGHVATRRTIGPSAPSPGWARWEVTAQPGTHDVEGKRCRS